MIRCPKCAHGSSVLESRVRHHTLRRKRECVKCKHRWFTIEVTADALRLLEDVQQTVKALTNRNRNLEAEMLAAGEVFASYVERLNEPNGDAR